MEWTGPGVVLSTRKHGETDTILEVMTAEHGRHLGLVRGGRSRKKQPLLQPGNELHLTWRARLADHLGVFAAEAVNLRSGDVMSTAFALHAVQHVAALLRLLPERDAHPRLYSALSVVLDHLDRFDIAGPLLVRFELLLLNELGFGLDLETCAATGRTDDLAYVSPKSGRAVSRDAGRPYHDRLLPLPGFLVEGQRQPGSEISYEDVKSGLALTGFFLDRDIQSPAMTGIADVRVRVLNALEREYRANYPWSFG